MTRTSRSAEMAHRQTGGYKEEPGVAVAGDHVSVLLFSKCSVYSGAQLACLSCALLCNKCCIATHSSSYSFIIIALACVQLSARIRKLFYFGLKSRGSKQGLPGGVGFESFQKITSCDRAGLEGA
jgi:hypothetical protein